MEKITEQEADAAAERRIGSGHEEMPTFGGQSQCGVCGLVDEADIEDEVVRAFHADSFFAGEEIV
jgi:bacterioferritin-associated ferredoxin